MAVKTLHGRIITIVSSGFHSSEMFVGNENV